MKAALQVRHAWHCACCTVDGGYLYCHYWHSYGCFGILGGGAAELTAKFPTARVPATLDCRFLDSANTL